MTATTLNETVGFQMMTRLSDSVMKRVTKRSFYVTDTSTTRHNKLPETEET